MSVKDKKNKDTRFVVLTTSKFKKEYKQYCLKYDIGMSNRILSLIEEDIENNKLKKNDKF